MEGDDRSIYNDCDIDPGEGTSRDPQPNFPALQEWKVRERKDSENTVFRLPVPTPRQKDATSITHEKLKTENRDSSESSGDERSKSAAAFDVIRKWRLNFAGRADEDAETFLSKLEDLRSSAKIDDTDLLRCLPICFSGNAAFWYKNRGKLSSWKEFVSEWRQNFFDPDYQELLEHDLRVRKQGDDEPVRDYLACMQMMMSRLDNPWSEEKCVKRIIWNAREKLRNVLSIDNIRTMRDVEKKLREAESNVSPGSADYYRSPQIANKIFAYKPQKDNNRSREFGRGKGYQNSRYEAVNAVEECLGGCRGGNPRPSERSSPAIRRACQGENPSRRDNVRQQPNSKRAEYETICAACSSEDKPRSNEPCWNCNKPGHRSRNCKEKPRIHCYRCGEPDVTTRECRKCDRKPENYRRNRS